MLSIAASKSDHGARVTEFLPALQDALKETPSDAVALEIGNREGGSAILILWHLHQEGRGRLLVTVDVDNPAPDALKTLAEEWSSPWTPPWESYTMKQRDFVEKVSHRFRFGFIYLDADHSVETVTQDMRALAGNMVVGGRLVVDDVQDWPELPDLFDVDLERVTYEVDQGDQMVSKPHGQHAVFYRKI